MATDDIGALKAEIAALREQLTQLASAVYLIGGENADAGDGMSEDDDSFQDVVPTIGGRDGEEEECSHMGNTSDSEKITGDVFFEAADDSNVKVKTDGNVIEIGVYYI